MPPSVSGLTALQDLDLSHNALVEVPQFLGSLSSLRCAGESSPAADAPGHRQDWQPACSPAARTCGRRVLPGSPLRGCRLLNIMKNRLEALPDELCGLAQLHRLGLKANRLQALPAQLGRLTALVELFLTDNRWAFMD